MNEVNSGESHGVTKAWLAKNKQIYMGRNKQVRIR